MVATKAKGVKKAPDILDHEKKNDWQRLEEHIHDNPVLWGAGVLFVVVCLLAGLAYRSNRSSGDAEAATRFARAVDNEDAAMRASELEQVAENGPLTADSLYLAAEAAYEAKDSEKAKQLFERLRNEFPQSEFTPNAVEGLGFIAENSNDLDAALAAYQEIIDKWPGSVARRRQEINIARVQERKENFKEAVDAYKAHSELYPDSTFAPEVEKALDRLKTTHPDLFPADTAEPAAAAEPAAEQPAETPAPEVPAAEAPAAEAPAAEPPAEQAAPQQ